MTGSPNLKKASVLNPAIGFGTNLVMSFDDGSTGLKYFYVYAFMPLLGAVLSVLFHELVYKKSQEVIFSEVATHEEKEGGLLG